MAEEIPKRHDPVAVWKRASVDVKKEFIGYPPRSSTATRNLLAEKPIIVTNLSQMTPDKQVTFIKRLLQNWPFVLERRALTWPLHAGILTNSVTSTFIATRISADIILMKASTPFVEAFRQCPKSPFLMAVYSSGITYLALYHFYNQKIVLREGNLCSTCLLMRNLAIAFASGIALPLFTTPYLSYYMLLQKGEKKFPLVKNYLNFLTLSWIGARAASPLVPRLAAFQFCIVLISTYVTIWGRNRFFATAEIDPDFIKEVIIKSHEKESIKGWLQNNLSKTPFLGRLIDDPTREQ